MAYDKLVDSARLDATFTSIADAIREKIGRTEPISDKEMAGQIPVVYENGYLFGNMDGYVTGYEKALSDGYNSGQADGIEQGKQAEYDRFWDAFQNYGNRTGYNECFRSIYWNDITFRPKYLIKLVGKCTNVFRQNGVTCSEAPLQLDTSQATELYYMFYDSPIEQIGTLDCRKVDAFTYAFAKCKALKSVEKIILKDDGSQTYVSTFAECKELQNIVIEGVIGQTISFANSSKLSKASIESIVNALSTTTNGVTLTLSQTAVTNAFGGTTAEEWTSLIGTKPNWTINLA